MYRIYSPFRMSVPIPRSILSTLVHEPCQLIAPSWQNGKTRERTWHGNGASTATRGNHSPKQIPLQCSLIGPLTLLDMVRVLPSKPEETFFISSFYFRLVFNREDPK